MPSSSCLVPGVKTLLLCNKTGGFSLLFSKKKKERSVHIHDALTEYNFTNVTYFSL